MKKTDFVKLPQALEAEKAILSAAMNDPKCIAAVVDLVSPDDFYLEKHKHIIEAIYALLSEDIQADIGTITTKLKELGHLKNGLGSYIGKLMGKPVSAGIEYHAEQIRNAAAKRRVIIEANKMIQAAQDEGPLADLESKTSAAINWIKNAFSEVSPNKCKSLTACDLVRTDFPEPKWAIPGLLVDGFTFLVGRPKQGKSMLALNIALSVAYGGKAMGAVAVDPGEVIYLALEDPWRRLKSRMLQMIGDAKPPERLILFNEWPRIDAGGLEQLEREIKRHTNLRLLIIDTFQKVKGENKSRSNVYEHDYGQVVALKSIADRAGIALLVVHHLRKSAGDDIFDTVSGSLGLTGAADSTLILDRKTGQADAVLHVTGRDVESAEYALKFDPRSLCWTLLGEACEVKTTEQQQAVYNCVKDYGHPISPAEIEKTTGIKRRNIYKILASLQKDGSIQKVGRGNYI